MEKQPAKRREEDGSDDRISKLPQHILHHILSLLSQKNAVQTCALSKPWRYLWYGRPNVEFSENIFGDNKEAFRSFFDKTLQRYHDQKLSMQQFLVKLCRADSESIVLLEKWIPIIVMNMSIKTFNLDLRYSWSDFALPSAVFQSESIQELYLARCNLNRIDSTDKVRLNRLQTLSLTEVYIADETFEKIMSSCHLIEYLVVHFCSGLRTAKMNNARSVKHFDCRLYEAEYQSIEIDNVPSLETIRIENCSDWYDHEHNYFPHLKSLFLHNVRLSTESFDNFSSSNFACLEELELDQCDGFEEFQLSSCSIKRLTINMLSDRRIKAANIDVANIRYFKLSADATLPSFSFTTTSSREWKSDIGVWLFKDSIEDSSSTWFVKLHELLKALSQSEISLDLYYAWGDWIIEDTHDGFYKHVVVEQMRLRAYCLSSSYPDFLNCVFRICRPRYVIGMHLHSNLKAEWQREDHQITETLWKILLKERETMSRFYFWLHDLKEVSMESFDENAKEWNHVQGTSLPEKQKIRFRLKWRD